MRACLVSPGDLPRPTKAGFFCIVRRRFEPQVDGEYRMAPLRSMPVPKLMELKSKVEAEIAAKVKSRRYELQMELSKLERHDPPGKKRGRKGVGVAPKYRNPKEPSQTWAGRGLQPLWLRDALMSGKKLDSFLIARAR